jgi:hypothetical protein
MAIGLFVAYAQAEIEGVEPTPPGETLLWDTMTREERISYCEAQINHWRGVKRLVELGASARTNQERDALALEASERARLTVTVRSERAVEGEGER